MTCEYDGALAGEPRSHPWTDAVTNSSARYYDLKKRPALIRTSLEDFLPWDRYAAIESFYAMLEWLNGPSSRLETNDCAFSGPEPNEHASIEKKLACSGRVMVLFRALAENLDPRRVEQWKNRLHAKLADIDRELEWGIVGTTVMPVRYLAMPGPAKKQLGVQVMISFWAFGDDESETMASLGRVIANLDEALRGGRRSDIPANGGQRSAT